LIHIFQDKPILEKPPYVCGHYHYQLTKNKKTGIMGVLSEKKR